MQTVGTKWNQTITFVPVHQGVEAVIAPSRNKIRQTHRVESDIQSNGGQMASVIDYVIQRSLYINRTNASFSAGSPRGGGGKMSLLHMTKSDLYILLPDSWDHVTSKRRRRAKGGGGGTDGNKSISCNSHKTEDKVQKKTHTVHRDHHRPPRPFTEVL